MPPDVEAGRLLVVSSGSLRSGFGVAPSRMILWAGAPRSCPTAGSTCLSARARVHVRANVRPQHSRA
eukprot:917742-Alexandrium_andersonii.AAC.1